MITLSELEKIASLAKLSLENVDVDALIADISEMVEFADEIVGAETDGVSAISSEKYALREDEVKDSYENSKLLSNAKDAENGFFVAARTGGALGEHNKQH